MVNNSSIDDGCHRDEWIFTARVILDSHFIPEWDGSIYMSKGSGNPLLYLLFEDEVPPFSSPLRYPSFV